MILTKTELSAIDALVKVTDADAVNLEDLGDEKQVNLIIGTKAVMSDWQDSVLDCIDDLTDFLDI